MEENSRQQRPCNRDQEGPLFEQKFSMRVKQVFRTEQMTFRGVQPRKIDEVLTQESSRSPERTDWVMS